MHLLTVLERVRAHSHLPHFTSFGLALWTFFNLSPIAKITGVKGSVPRDHVPDQRTKI